MTTNFTMALPVVIEPLAGGGIPPDFTCFARSSFLLGVWGAPFGECQQGQKIFSPNSHRFQPVCMVSILIWPCATFTLGGKSDKYTSNFTIATNTIYLLSECQALNSASRQCNLGFYLLGIRPNKKISKLFPLRDRKGVASREQSFEGCVGITWMDTRGRLKTKKICHDTWAYIWWVHTKLKQLLSSSIDAYLCL